VGSWPAVEVGAHRFGGVESVEAIVVEALILPVGASAREGSANSGLDPVSERSPDDERCRLAGFADHATHRWRWGSLTGPSVVFLLHGLDPVDDQLVRLDVKRTLGWIHVS
jgi:hypothetical protein